MKTTLATLFLWLAGLSLAADPGKPPVLQAATVTKVNDGDSIEVRLESGPRRVRLSGIDTPEADQPHAEQASAALRSLLPVGTVVELEVVTEDQFKRLVAEVWTMTGGQRLNVNEIMLRQGHAWAYRRYMRDARYCTLEADARDQKAGLWALPVSEWVYPPEWRLLKNGEIRVLPTSYAETRETCLEVFGKAGKGTYQYQPPR